MAVRVLFSDGKDTVYYGAHGVSLRGRRLLVTKADSPDDGTPAIVAVLDAGRVAKAEIVERGIIKRTIDGFGKQE